MNLRPDGLEPLQYVARGGGRMDEAKVGGVKDPGIKALFSLLADDNPGLCLVTTRIRLSELAGNSGVTFEPLVRLPLMAGIELLRDLGVEPDHPPAQYQLPQRDEFKALVAAYTPPEDYTPPLADTLPTMPARIAKDLIAAVEELQGHALALTLIGNYLAEHHHGDIRAVHDLPPLAELAPDAPERSPYRVMRAIEIALARHIEEQGKTEKPAEMVAGRELALLFFLGLFDRPADAALLPVVFPDKTGDYLQPDAADLALAAKNLIPIKKQLHELKQEQLTDIPDWRKEEIAQEERPLLAERDEVFKARRRVLVRRALAGLAEGLLDRHQIVEALHGLARRGLISKFSENASFDRASIDCHPMVREYFGARLKELDRESFKAAHNRLYDHYRFGGLPTAFQDAVAYALLAAQRAFPDHGAKRIVEALLQGGRHVFNAPPTLIKAKPEQLRKAKTLIGGAEWELALKAFSPDNEAGMTPLFTAITHGCAAERETETFIEVYLPRIARYTYGGLYFATETLRLFGQDLAALASFFEAPFQMLSPRLAEGSRAAVLNGASFDLRALGRLEDAVAPTRAAVESYKARDVWDEASRNAGNLSELLVTIGCLSGGDGAVTTAEAAVVLANRSGDARRGINERSRHAAALLQAGSLARAAALFYEAEALQKNRQPSLPLLYSLNGYYYCDLLLTSGRASEASIRAEVTRWWSKQVGGARHLNITLDTLTQARAALAAIPPSAPAPQECAARATEALAALRRANDEIYIPRGLLARAEALWRCGDTTAANEPLREAEAIAARGPMPLFAADAHLLRARIALSQANLIAAKEKREDAAKLIEKHGYGKAKPELALLDAEIACAENAANREAAIDTAFTAIRGEPYHDKRTGRTMDGGWWGLLPRLELLLASHDVRLADLRAARDAYNAERAGYLNAEGAKDLEADFLLRLRQAQRKTEDAEKKRQRKAARHKT